MKRIQMLVRVANQHVMRHVILAIGFASWVIASEVQSVLQSAGTCPFTYASDSIHRPALQRG